MAYPIGSLLALADYYFRHLAFVPSNHRHCENQRNKFEFFFLSKQKSICHANDISKYTTHSAHSSGCSLMAWYKYFKISFEKFSPSLSSARFSINSEHVIFLPIFWPCKSVFRSIIAHVSVWTASKKLFKRINQLNKIQIFL